MLSMTHKVILAQRKRAEREKKIGQVMTKRFVFHGADVYERRGTRAHGLRS